MKQKCFQEKGKKKKNNKDYGEQSVLFVFAFFVL